jgi:hypothetical protein
METEFHVGARTDGRTERPTDMTNIIVAFHHFEKAPISDFIEKKLARGWRLINAFIFGRLIKVFITCKHMGRISKRTTRASLERNSIL